MGGQEIRSWARGLYTLNEIRFEPLHPQFPPYPAFPPSLPSLSFLNTLFILLPTTAIALVLFVLLVRVLGGGEDRLWLVRAPS